MKLIDSTFSNYDVEGENSNDVLNKQNMRLLSVKKMLFHGL